MLRLWHFGLSLNDPVRFRFTIRDLLWLTLVVAMGVGWRLDRRAIERQSAVEFNALREDYSRLRNQVMRGRTDGFGAIPGVPPMKVAP